MNNFEDFSVVIPTKNEANYLEILLKSISTQSIKPQEIIVSDGNSSDNTTKVAEEFGCKVTIGGSPAQGRNNGAKLVNSDIIIFLDADTRLSKPDFFEKAIQIFNKRKLDLGICFAKNEKGNKPFGKLSIYGTNTRRVFDIIFYKLFKKILGGSGWFIIIKKSVFDNLKGFDEHYVNYEDTDFFNRAVSSGHKFGLLPLSVYLSGRRYNKVKLSRLIITQFYLLLFKFTKISKGKFSDLMLEKYEKLKGGLGGR